MNITPAQVELVRAKLPKEDLEEGFAIRLFVALSGSWRACVELVNGNIKILEGTD